jgi:preprotein translocase subunit YajC
VVFLVVLTRLVSSLFDIYPGALTAPAHALLVLGDPAAAPAAPGPSPLSTLVFPLLLVGAYFLIFAPAMKRQKDHRKYVETLGVGSEVLTTGGIFGVITQIKDDRLVVEIAKGLRVEVERSHVEARPAAPADKSKPAS